MKANFILAGIASLAVLVLADSCTPGLTYCGHSLILKGDYQGRIVQALSCAGIEEVDSGHSALYVCEGGPGGVIYYTKSCAQGTCVDAGSGQNDHC
ncbi:hypothetical protein MVEN_00209700 [Mycena venus]|uniref:Uncharacterized protein n=1 Tax=Mycena venus TaxID=2733690 RepID=A0A8H6YYJ1_9AGAR|nr:hypothetical protein MVEN_00209700 [Mycena venus]